MRVRILTNFSSVGEGGEIRGFIIGAIEDIPEVFATKYIRLGYCEAYELIEAKPKKQRMKRQPSFNLEEGK